MYDDDIIFAIGDDVKMSVKIFFIKQLNYLIFYNFFVHGVVKANQDVVYLN
jgi:hypothetical protein